MRFSSIAHPLLLVSLLQLGFYGCDSKAEDPDQAFEEICPKACEKELAVGCSVASSMSRSLCVGGCLEFVDEVPCCHDEMFEVFRCIASTDISGFECASGGGADLKDGVCDAERSALGRCYRASLPSPSQICASRCDVIGSLGCPVDTSLGRDICIWNCESMFAQYPDCAGDLLLSYNCPDLQMPANWECGADGAAAPRAEVCWYGASQLEQCLAQAPQP